VPSRVSSLNILILLDKVYTKKLVIVPEFGVFFKGKPFLVSVSTKVKPQFPHIIILHNSDGSSCIIGFMQKGSKLEHKH